MDGKAMYPLAGVASRNLTISSLSRWAGGSERLRVKPLRRGTLELTPAYNAVRVRCLEWYRVIRAARVR